MNKSIKIAKDILMIAKELCGSDEYRNISRNLSNLSKSFKSPVRDHNFNRNVSKSFNDIGKSFGKIKTGDDNTGKECCSEKNASSCKLGSIQRSIEFWSRYASKPSDNKFIDDVSLKESSEKTAKIAAQILDDEEKKEKITDLTKDIKKNITGLNSLGNKKMKVLNKNCSDKIFSKMTLSEVLDEIKDIIDKE